jgi:hypothetical protein
MNFEPATLINLQLKAYELAASAVQGNVPAYQLDSKLKDLQKVIYTDLVRIYNETLSTNK